MSDVILLGVLEMPMELWRDDPDAIISDARQRHSRYIQAAQRIRDDGAEIDRLRAEVERLTLERDKIHDMYITESGLVRIYANDRRRALDERDAAREALRVYGRHDEECPLSLTYRDADDECECGFDAALKEGER